MLSLNLRLSCQSNKITNWETREIQSGSWPFSRGWWNPGRRLYACPSRWSRRRTTRMEWHKERRKAWDDDSPSFGEDLPWMNWRLRSSRCYRMRSLDGCCWEGPICLHRQGCRCRQAFRSCRDIEMALRDQEGELLQADQQRHPHGKKRTYWVEEQGQWGLWTFLMRASTMAWTSYGLETVYVLKYMDTILLMAMELARMRRSTGTTTMMGGMALFLTVKGAGWRPTAMVPTGLRKILFGKKTFTWGVQRAGWGYCGLWDKGTNLLAKSSTPTSQREEPRLLPRRKTKGKGKGKNGKGFGTTSSSSSTSMSASTPTCVAQSDVMAANANVGCFVCGDRGHGFRNCPKRSNNNLPPSEQRHPEGHLLGWSCDTELFGFCGHGGRSFIENHGHNWLWCAGPGRNRNCWLSGSFGRTDGPSTPTCCSRKLFYGNLAWLSKMFWFSWLDSCFISSSWPSYCGDWSFGRHVETSG